jgi:hypothetical protein
LAGCKTQTPTIAAPASDEEQKSTYVIVHGAWGGGWDWKDVDHLLTAGGNIVYRPTLTGLGNIPISTARTLISTRTFKM